MKVKGLVGLLLLVAVLVSACGGAAFAPQAAVSETGIENDVSVGVVANEQPEDMMAGDESDDMMKEEDSVEMAHDDDSDDMMKEDESDDMVKEDESNDMMKEDDSDDTMKEDEPKAIMEEDSMADYPAWFSAELIDVNSGEAFRVTDLKGKVVLVETMAIWCSNCLRQQNEVKTLHEAWGERDDLVTLVLDIDPNENAENLQAYTAKHGFTWRYAVAPRDVAREIGQLYGDQYLNPPSTPMLIIDRDGEVHLLPFGRKSADSLRDALEPFLSEG